MRKKYLGDVENKYEYFLKNIKKVIKIKRVFYLYGEYIYNELLLRRKKI